MDSTSGKQSLNRVLDGAISFSERYLKPSPTNIALAGVVGVGAATVFAAFVIASNAHNGAFDPTLFQSQGLLSLATDGLQHAFHSGAEVVISSAKNIATDGNSALHSLRSFGENVWGLGSNTASNTIESANNVVGRLAGRFAEIPEKFAEVSQKLAAIPAKIDDAQVRLSGKVTPVTQEIKNIEQSFYNAALTSSQQAAARIMENEGVSRITDGVKGTLSGFGEVLGGYREVFWGYKNIGMGVGTLAKEGGYNLCTDSSAQATVLTAGGVGFLTNLGYGVLTVGNKKVSSGVYSVVKAVDNTLKKKGEFVDKTKARMTYYVTLKSEAAFDKLRSIVCKADEGLNDSAKKINTITRNIENYVGNTNLMKRAIEAQQSLDNSAEKINATTQNIENRVVSIHKGAKEAANQTTARVMKIDGMPEIVSGMKTAAFGMKKLLANALKLS